MKILQASAALMALLFATSSLAQDDNDHRQGGHPGFEGNRAPGMPHQQGGASSQQDGAPNGAGVEQHERLGPQENSPSQATPRGEEIRHGNPWSVEPPPAHERQRRGPQGNGAVGNDRSNWSGGPNPGPLGRNSARARVDARMFKNVQAPHRFHAGTYNPPAGWHPRRWHFGEFLPRAFFIREYWITNFWFFGLFPPPPGLVWVRVGDDALLVDTYTGEVVEVVYDVFF